MQVEDMSRDELLEIIKRLPRTADGVRIVPGQIGWTNRYHNGKCIGTIRAICAPVPCAYPADETAVSCHASGMYSTRKAALLAATRETQP